MLTGRTGLQSPLPISKPSERVSGRGGSGNHRWVNREGSWVVVWQMCLQGEVSSGKGQEPARSALARAGKPEPVVLGVVSEP